MSQIFFDTMTSLFELYDKQFSDVQEIIEFQFSIVFLRGEVR